MCGFLGYVAAKANFEIYKSKLSSATDLLIHRGPDGVGTWADEPCGLGSRRLAILDLSSDGNQPFSSEDGTIHIVFNGEIYNFRDLREKLEATGHRFVSGTDTEVILHLYQEKGDRCIKMLRGMFAFGIWDARRRRLLLARDIVGEKPLFYRYDGQSLLFASEIKAILAFPGVPRRVDLQTLPYYLTHGYAPSPRTMFEGIHELPPGHTLALDGDNLKIEQYWDIPSQSGSGGWRSEGEIVERLRVLLREAVRTRLVSDVPLGAFLSGGVDSTALVAFMADLLPDKVKTFSIGFSGESSFNELRYARLASQTYGTDHHEFVVRPDSLELLPRLIWHHEQPFSDSSAIPTYLVSRLARQHVTVALTGDGGDELFAGYERFAANRVADIYARIPSPLQKGLARLVRLLPESTAYGALVRNARRFTENAPLPLPRRYLGLVGIFDEGYIRHLLRDNSGALEPVEHIEAIFRKIEGLDAMSQILYVNAKTYLAGDLLAKTDRMSMASSLEARCPFLDQELLEFAAQLPSNLKIRGLTTKYILKKALEGLVPKEIIYRRKHGFGVPIGQWFRTSLKEYVRDVLLSSQCLSRGYFEAEAVKTLVDEHQAGNRDYGNRLWALLTFELWHQGFIDRAPISSPPSHLKEQI